MKEVIIKSREEACDDGLRRLWDDRTFDAVERDGTHYVFQRRPACPERTPCDVESVRYGEFFGPRADAMRATLARDRANERARLSWALTNRHDIKAHELLQDEWPEVAAVLPVFDAKCSRDIGDYVSLIPATDGELVVTAVQGNRPANVRLDYKKEAELLATLLKRAGLTAIKIRPVSEYKKSMGRVFTYWRRGWVCSDRIDSDDTHFFELPPAPEVTP